MTQLRTKIKEAPRHVNLQASGRPQAGRRVFRTAVILIALAVLIAGGIHLGHYLVSRQDYDVMVQRSEGTIDRTGPNPARDTGR